MSGDTLAVGAYFEDSAATGVNSDDPGPSNNSATNSGAAYVYWGPRPARTTRPFMCRIVLNLSAAGVRPVSVQRDHE